MKPGFHPGYQAACQCSCWQQRNMNNTVLLGAYWLSAFHACAPYGFAFSIVGRVKPGFHPAYGATGQFASGQNFLEGCGVEHA